MQLNLTASLGTTKIVCQEVLAGDLGKYVVNNPFRCGPHFVATEDICTSICNHTVHVVLLTAKPFIFALFAVWYQKKNWKNLKIFEQVEHLRSQGGGSLKGT